MKFGDNDTLSAHIASLADADYLFLLTDVDGLYTGNPNSDPNASLIPLVENIEDLDVDTSAGAGSNWHGRMATKISRRADGHRGRVSHRRREQQREGNLADIVVKGAPSARCSSPCRNHWAGGNAGSLQKPAAGHVVVNGKAEIALNNDKSLMGTHILAVEGAFEADEAVPLMVIDEETGRSASSGAPSSTTAARGVKLIGQQSDDFFDIVGYSGASPSRTEITSACGCRAGRRRASWTSRRSTWRRTRASPTSANSCRTNPGRRRPSWRRRPRRRRKKTNTYAHPVIHERARRGREGGATRRERVPNAPLA